MKSRPIYGKLEPRLGHAHLLVADGEGANAILEIAQVASPEFLEQADIIYVATDLDEDGFARRLRQLSTRSLHLAPSIAAALPRLARVLSASRMGLQLYLAGTEGLIGQSMKVAMENGLSQGAILTEHRGSLARRVQCVHCKWITENVTTQPCVCSHCGLNLLVRDHYSRRIAAFQGVCIDSEEPGSAPEPREVFR